MRGKHLSRSAKNTIVFISVALAAIAVDQAAKLLVVGGLEPGRSVTVIPGLLKLTHSTNTGAAFGLMKGNSQLVFLAALVVVCLTIGWFFAFRWRRSLASFVGLGLIIGGAIGNLIDRLARQKVVDFLDLGWWPVFNIADIAIVAGVIIVVIVSAREILKEEPEAEGGGTTIAS